MNTFDSRYMQLQIEKLEDIINKRKTATEVAIELGISRQSIHKWLNRYKRFGSEGLLRKKVKRRTNPWNRTSFEVEQIVIKVASKHWNDGVQTLCDHLSFEHTIHLNPSTIYRILKRNGVRYTDRYPHTRKKWKKRLYAHTVPGMELQMDTKYPFGYKQGKVIYTCIDDASRFVFAYMYETANQTNTLDFIERVRMQAPFLIQKIRTDNGKEFIAKNVRSHLKNHNIIHRTNTPYCPEENGKIERFHRTLNEKLLPFGFFPQKAMGTLQYLLKLFLYTYNFKRRHRGLGMEGKTPVQKLEELSVNLTLQCYKI